jgi:hypothetical protein
MLKIYGGADERLVEQMVGRTRDVGGTNGTRVKEKT